MFGDKFKKHFITSSSNGFMQLTIMPTEKCNFRCVYCYEDFKIGKMKEDTIEGIKNLISGSASNLKRLVVQWFGGEPTLNEKAIIEISEHIKMLQAKHGFQFLAHMTTNGYLLDQDMFSRFIDLSIIDYQITLDGIAEQHDKTRKMISGKGTFERIWENLLGYQKTDFDFHLALRLHVTRDNADAMLALSKKLKQQFGDDKRYMTTIRAISNLGDSVEGDVSQYIPKDKASVGELINEMKQILSPEKQTDKYNLADNPYICYASMPRHLTIRADGRIAKCTVMFDDDRNDLGRINRDGSVEINGKKMELWTRGFVSLDKKELGCPATKLPKLYSQEEIIAVSSVA